LGFRIFVKDEFTYFDWLDDVLWPLFGGVKNIKIEAVNEISVWFVDKLYIFCPFWIVAPVNIVVQIVSSKTKWLFDSFVVIKRFYTLLGFPIVSGKINFSFFIDPFVGVNSPAVDFSITVWNSYVVEEPRKHVGALRIIWKVIVNSPPFLNSRKRVRFQGSDHFRESNSISDEKNRKIEPNNIVVSFFSVHFNCKSSRISQKFWTSFAVNHSGPSTSNWSFLSFFKYFSKGVLGNIGSLNVISLGYCSTSMNISLRNSFSIVVLKTF